MGVVHGEEAVPLRLFWTLNPSPASEKKDLVEPRKRLTSLSQENKGKLRKQNLAVQNHLDIPGF
ncbi:MAG TPA: hypothetical protein VFV38_00115 [Ktedonobacteraceae bacterium]|nr:hypothetical protein [Ktedonobacteraceae bacterium]